MKPTFKKDNIVRINPKHCLKDKFDDSDLCIVVEDIETKQIFLIGNKRIR